MDKTTPLRLLYGGPVVHNKMKSKQSKHKLTTQQNEFTTENVQHNMTGIM